MVAVAGAPFTDTRRSRGISPLHVLHEDKIDTTRYGEEIFRGIYHNYPVVIARLSNRHHWSQK
jgi:hypothetical protein